MSSKKKTTLWYRAIKASLITLLVIVLGICLLIAAVRYGLFGELPTTEQLAALRNEEATLVYSSDGALIGKVFAQDRTNIHYKDLPQHLIDALVATEDQRFFSHEGVDTWSYARVFIRSILGGDASGGGGSTISQQIIKNLYGRERHGPLTVPVNKIKEAIVAQRLESVYSKEDVLALYFNSVPFGEDLYGVETAAQRFFSRSAAKLTVEEGAVLVGMLKANTLYNPRLHPERSRQRRDQVLGLMRDRGYIPDAVSDSLQLLPLRLRYRGPGALDAYGYFAARVATEARTILAGLDSGAGPYDIEKDGLRIHTTLDTALQHAAIASVRAHLATMQPKLDRELRGRKARKAWEKQVARSYGKAWKVNTREVRDVFRWSDEQADTLSFRDSLWHYHGMLHAAVLMMEPASGKVRAWVGGNDHRSLPYDLVEARRPIASTIKPVLYAAAIENGSGPCDYLDNNEKDYEEYESWHPRNFDGSSGGEMALWNALAHSVNLPTVDLYFRTGAEPVKRMFHALDLPTENTDKPALALGAADISLKEIVRAYGAFAMRGNTTTPRMIERITDADGRTIWQAKEEPSTLAMGATTAATITVMLQRAVDEGTGASLRSRFGVSSEIAGKTGTSQNFSDAWFVTYTPGLVIGTWVGARDPEIHFSGGMGTGSQLALPIVGNVLRDIEGSRKLRKRYLLSFDWLANYEVDMDCPPIRDGTVIERIFNDVWARKDKEARRGADTADQKENKKSFWRKLFPKKKR